MLRNPSPRLSCLPFGNMSMILINQSIDKNEIKEKPNSSASRELPQSAVPDTTESNHRFHLNLWHVYYLKHKDKKR